MTPAERLRSWQPDASMEQLAVFAQENHMLLGLLDDCWRKFQETHADLFQAALPVAESHYAEGFSVDDLEHFPVSDEEMAAFLNAFDRERERTDLPLGETVEIKEQDWEIED